MCAVWWYYLSSKGLAVKDGVRGFVYILTFNSAIIGFFVMMIFVTH